MIRYIFSIVFIFVSGLCLAQHSITIDATLNPASRSLDLVQDIRFVNTSQDTLYEILLLDWANSFSDKTTPLAQRFGDFVAAVDGATGRELRPRPAESARAVSLAAPADDSLVRRCHSDPARGDAALAPLDFRQQAADPWRGSDDAPRREMLDCVHLNRTLSDVTLRLGLE